MNNMSDSHDLTRWNRAGLRQLEYTEGNAATYQEDLRIYLRGRFSHDDAVLQWLGDAANDATLAKWQQRLLEQYQSERRDYIWELLRTFSRAVHILAHTVNAYANERYIRTATQWDNVRRLVNMLDYHPAPPASAETHIALFAKADKQAMGTVDKGLALQNSPTDGTSPLTFETLNDLDVDYRLNELKAPDHNQSIVKASISSAIIPFHFYIKTIPDDITVGERAILADLAHSIAVQIQSVKDKYLVLQVIESNFSPVLLSVAEMRLYRSANWKQAPRLNGLNVAEVDQTSNIKVGDVLVYKSSSHYYPKKVQAIEGDRVAFNDSIIQGQTYFATQRVSGQFVDADNRFVIPKQRACSSVWLANLTAQTPDNQYQRNQEGEETSAVLYHYIASELTSQVYYLAEETPESFTVTNSMPDKFAFAGSPEGLQSNQLILLKSSDDQWVSRKIKSVDEQENGYSIQVYDLPDVQSWVHAEADFDQAVTALNYDKNYTQLAFDHTETSSKLTVQIEGLPEVLIYGRLLWVSGVKACRLVSLIEAEIDSANEQTTLLVTPSLQDMDLPSFSSKVYANVVLAGHGETRAQNILGDGDRTLANQTFIYKKQDIAFVQDTEFSSGVKAAVEVWVDGRRWKQVENLRDSESVDTAYQIDLTEDDNVVFKFGDGIHGQRLPTQTNNVRVQARFGHGIKGNLPAFSLDKLKKPHDLVDTLIQLKKATGGGDLESSESLRSNGPASVLTLSRAVSIADFQALAKRQSNVWHAHAYSLPDRPGSTDQIQVVAVPAGGGVLGTQAESLAILLQNQARPGVHVFVKSYQAVLLSLEITIRVDSVAYRPEAVAEAVKQELIKQLSLQQASFGRTLFRSLIYQIVESIEGVENADCIINPDGFIDESGTSLAEVNTYIGDDGFIRKISPNAGQIIYLNNAIAPPVIKTEAYND